jgi:hypothetical protein
MRNGLIKASTAGQITLQNRMRKQQRDERSVEVNNAHEVGRRGGGQEIFLRRNDEHRIMQNENGYLKHVNVELQDRKHEYKNEKRRAGRGHLDGRYADAARMNLAIKRRARDALPACNWPASGPEVLGPSKSCSCRSLHA